MSLRTDAHKTFVSCLQQYINENVPAGTILTSRTLKAIVKTLPADHKVIVEYNEYLKACGSDVIQNWTLEEFTRMANHMKYLNGYYREIAYQKRVGSGTSAKYITVRAHRVKV